MKIRLYIYIHIWCQITNRCEAFHWTAWHGTSVTHMDSYALEKKYIYTISRSPQAQPPNVPEKNPASPWSSRYILPILYIPMSIPSLVVKSPFYPQLPMVAGEKKHDVPICSHKNHPFCWLQPPISVGQSGQFDQEFPLNQQPLQQIINNYILLVRDNW